MSTSGAARQDETISVLIVDDSIVFRRFLRDIFEGSNIASICGEAKNGIEALDVMLRVNPDVIMMDMEMPLMDGMTALQHLMIHRPVPTIMFSSLTREGTVRAFDALKNGAVDFLCKDFIFTENDPERQKENVLQKVIRAAKMSVKRAEPLLENTVVAAIGDNARKQVTFCEECGARNIFDFTTADFTTLVCTNCGDPLLIHDIHDLQDYIRFITVIGGGEGAFRNLLNIIPYLNGQLGGSVITIIHADSQQIDTFADYLDTISPIRVLRIREGMRLERGCCYIASAFDYVCLRPQGMQYILKMARNEDHQVGSLDLVMASISSVFREKTAGVILSGSELDGVRGVSTILKNSGVALALSPKNCLCQDLVRAVLGRTGAENMPTEKVLAHRINMMHGNTEDSQDT